MIAKGNGTKRWASYDRPAQQAPVLRKADTAAGCLHTNLNRTISTGCLPTVNACTGSNSRFVDHRWTQYGQALTTRLQRSGLDTIFKHPEPSEKVYSKRDATKEALENPIKLTLANYAT